MFRRRDFWTLLLIAAVVVDGGWLLHLGGSEWPSIKDPAALRREAAGLCREGGGWRELQPAQYPPGMAGLHPASIKVSGERVYLELVPGAASKHRYHGYSVWPDTVARADGGITREESDGGPVPGL